ncbi:uncharacterized protein LOC110838079 [Zootermopsis nevadensis]|uniref:uncharacterized protein LOC110838079 n=1 Tax=Zootermopsis nevadensis TaxID=136037 RepID=UPI000B8EB23D|nr:uncharacterized protein LOC110838079 [Zootermopsis nevadensis]
MEGQRQLPTRFLHKVLEEIVEEAGLANTRIEIESGSSRGDNYLSVIYRVKVSGQRANAGCELKQDGVNFIFKCLPESKVRREEMKTSNYFNNEANFYNKVLPEFLSLQRERGVPVQDTFCCTAKCYRALNTDTTKDIKGAEEVLVLEDMQQQGYMMLDRYTGLDVTHCQLVLDQLAKLHAFSFAMRDQKPEQFNGLKDSVSETLYEETRLKGLQEYVASLEPLIDEALMTRVPGVSKYKQRASDFIHNYYNTMLKCVDGAEAEPYAVICHGDCWNNNYLFKYGKDDSKPTGVILLDFQLSRYSSPVLDLSYFIASCTDHALRCEHYDLLLARYYDSLARFIRLLGSDPQKLFPQDVFQNNIKWTLEELDVRVWGLD